MNALEIDTENLIQCRASNGIALPPAMWEAGKPVQFIYAPAGKHLITAGFRKGESITICVENDPQTAVDLQASYDHLMATEPNQEPFSDEDHDAKKATLRFPNGITKFSWGAIKGNEGVIVAAEPTSYGAEAVNGKVYRSWSPEFATDADYSKAKCKAGHWSFPEGVRGSESNPARIVGVSFVMGALTNRPAFRAMPPVKAKKADGERGEVQATWSDAAREAAREARMAANGSSDVARNATRDAEKHNNFEFHSAAAGAHDAAYKAHKEASLKAKPGSEHEQYHKDAMNFHDQRGSYHYKAANKASGLKSSTPSHLTLTEIASAVLQATQGSDRFGAEPQVLDILRNEEEDTWAAVFASDEGTGAISAGFTLNAAGEVELQDDLVNATVKACYGDAVCFNGKLVVKATGTSEGAKKGWLERANSAQKLSALAHKASANADELDTKDSHVFAMNENRKAELEHEEAEKEASSEGMPHREFEHRTMAELHGRRVNFHERAATQRGGLKSSTPTLDSLYLKAEAKNPTLEAIYEKSGEVKAGEVKPVKPSLETIFARVGANGVPAAVTN